MAKDGAALERADGWAVNFTFHTGYQNTNYKIIICQATIRILMRKNDTN